MPTEEAKKNYPGKWKQAQQSAQEVYGLEVGTEEYRLKCEQLFVELGGEPRAADAVRGNT